MNESVLVYGIVLGAGLFVGWRLLPAAIRARFAPTSGSSCSSGSCGSKNCGDGGCH